MRLERAWRPAPGSVLEPPAEIDLSDDHAEEIAEPTTLTSEDVHGGQESAQDIPDSPSPGGSDDEAESDAIAYSALPEDGEEDAEASATPGSPSDSAAETDSTSASASGEPSAEADDEADDQESDSDSAAVDAAPTDSAEDEGGDEADESGDGEDLEAADSDSSDESDGDGEATEEDWGEPEEASASESDADDPGQRNYRQVVQLDLARIRRRRLQAEFARILAAVAEDLVGPPVPGDELWDVEALMLRRLTRRPLASCRMDREREAVILVLDTSGSCEEQAEFYADLAQIAARLGDVELYTAPNAGLYQHFDPRAGWVPVEKEAWPFHGRVILFFGDFDGGDQLVLASRRNKVYWFSSENRYRDLSEHDWNHFTLRDFRGQYWPCRDPEEFVRLARKVRA